MSLVAVLIIIGIWTLLRRTRTRHKNPKYVPTPFLKRLWQKWEPSPIHYRLPDNDHLEPQRSNALRPSTSSNPNPSTTEPTTTTGVDRNTSVRSVMTLPAYNPSARPTELVLGRAGDRAGIDIVLEFPESTDTSEALREAEMEALYQVRLARRRENEERDERRRLRREARERGDYVALRELQAQAAQGRNRAGSATSGNGQWSVDEARAEHERVKKERQRAVSSVSYADLGVARHDGTRLRANSNDSEREGLLGDAASIAASTRTGISGMSGLGGRFHRRDRSASSVLSIDTVNSDLPSPGLTRSRANSRPESPLRRVDTASARAGSSPEMVEHEDGYADGDLGGLNSPPGYENISLDEGAPPPDYSSPIMARGEGRALFDGSSPYALGTAAQRPMSTLQHETELHETEPPSTQHRHSSTSSTSQDAPPAISSPPISSQNQTTSHSQSPPPTHERRRSSTHIASLIDERRVSAGRGVGGAPQLPSLRLARLPSIQVDGPEGTPVLRDVDGEGDGVGLGHGKGHISEHGNGDVGR